jgi:hypothetical protein
MSGQKYNFHLPSRNLSLYQKTVYITGINVFNNLPRSIQDLSNDTKQFKSELSYRVFHKEWTNFEALFRSTQATPRKESHAITKSVV